MSVNSPEQPQIAEIDESDYKFLQNLDRLASFKINKAMEEGVPDDELPINLNKDSDEELGLFAFQCDALKARLEELVDIVNSNRHTTLLALGRRMRDKGKGEFTLLDAKGNKICAIKSNVEIYTKILDKDKLKEWLEEHELASIMKPVLHWPDDDESRNMIKELLIANNHGDQIDFEIHHATLGSAMKEHAYAGEILPDEQDGIKITLQPLAKISKARG